MSNFKYQFNPLLLNEEKGLLKLFKQKGKVRNALAAGLKKVRKHNAADPIMIASMNPFTPGSEILSLAYTTAIPKNTRARIYKNTLEHPVRSILKTPVEIPKTSVKIVKELPKATREVAAQAYEMGGKAYHHGSYYAAHPMYAFNTALSKIPFIKK